MKGDVLSWFDDLMQKEHRGQGGWQVRSVIKELIAADREYDAANLALRSLDARDFDSGDAFELEYDALCQRCDEATARRDSAIAKVTP